MASPITLSPDGIAVGKMIKFKKLQWAIVKMEKRLNEETEREEEIYVPIATFPTALKDLYSDEKTFKIFEKGEEGYPKTYKLGYKTKQMKDEDDQTVYFQEEVFPEFTAKCVEELKICCGFGLINVEYMDEKNDNEYPWHCPVMVQYCDDTSFTKKKEARLHKTGKYMAASSQKNILTDLAGFHCLEVNDVASLQDYSQYVEKCKKQ
jgi:hypothetical protein